MLMTINQAGDAWCPVIPRNSCLANGCACWRWHTQYPEDRIDSIGLRDRRILDRIGPPPPSTIQNSDFDHEWDLYYSAFRNLPLTLEDFPCPENWAYAEDTPCWDDADMCFYVRLRYCGPPRDLGYCGLAGLPSVQR